MPSQSRNTRAELPGYAFDPRLGGTGRYRHVLPNGKLGRIVSRDEIVGLLRTVSDASGAKFADMARAAVEGRITPAEFFRAMQGELRALYNSTSALAVGGWNKMGPVEWGRNGQILRGEWRYLAGFAQAIANGELTPEQAEARARLYAGKAYSRFWAEDRLQQIAAGMVEERWDDTGDDRECSDCHALAARGWVPIGTLPSPGDGSTACLGACRCSVETRGVGAAKFNPYHDELGRFAEAGSGRMADDYKPPKFVVNSSGEKVIPPRQFYRGTVPGDTRRIRTGSSEWDSYLFVSDTERYARDYGPNITRVNAKPDAKILYEGTAEYRKLAVGTSPARSMMEHVSTVAKRAKSEGFDAVWYKRQSDVGTAILNPDAFETLIA